MQEQNKTRLRLKPYTPKQLEKEKCFRCGAPAEYQWSACADQNVWRPLCRQCDFDLNVMVIKWMGFKDWKRKLKDYASLIKVKFTGK